MDRDTMIRHLEGIIRTGWAPVDTPVLQEIIAELSRPAPRCSFFSDPTPPVQRFVYQLQASGATTLGHHAVRFNTVLFSSQAGAEKRREAFKGAVCDGGLLEPFDPATVQIEVKTLEVVE